MKIIYFGNHDNKGSDFTEKHIKYALERLGHKVFCVDENNWTKNNVVNLSRGADLFLFHKAGVKEQKTYQRFMDLLVCITCKKVCWYFDKVWGEREIVLQAIIPFIDKLFLTDETWARKHNYKNIEILHQGIGIEDTSLGTPREDLKTDIAFVGMVYGERQRFIEKLLEKYGDKLRVFGNIFNRDLYDLCASTKIVVAPDSPSDDFYWSSRVYMILGSGGFLIHPKCEGLKEEYTHKEELVTYSDFDDLLSKIDFYLVNDKKRKAIQKKGYDKTIKSFNYLERCKILLEKSFIGKNV